MPQTGIDVSSHQGVFPWEAIRDSIDFAILRSSHGMDERDEQFERNYAECKRLGIPVGAYHYYYWSDWGKHQIETSNFLEAIKGKTFEFPVFIDYEEGFALTPTKLGSLSKEKITEYAKDDLARIRKAGHRAGLYANKHWLTDKINVADLDLDMVWLAQYAAKPSYAGEYRIWQYTSSGSIPGYDGRLDMNYYYPPVEQEAFVVLKRGMRSDLVKTMQKRLAHKGYSVAIDGVFGGQTEKVLKAFQADNDLRVDGWYGKASHAMLDSFRTYSLAADGETYVTKNIKVKELACNDGSDLVVVDMVAANRAQKIRDIEGRPIIINSAYRTAYWNKIQKGAKNSLHLKGMAIDFVIQGVPPRQMYEKLNKTYKGGMGRYNAFTHIDSGPRRRWVG